MWVRGKATVSMFYLLVEIHNVRQLQKIKQSYMSSVERSLLNLLESRGARHVREDGGDHLFLFSESQGSEPAALVDAAFSTYRFLMSHRDDLMGFLLLLDAPESEEDEVVLRRMRAQVRTVDLDEALLVGETAAPGFESLLKMHWSGGHWVVDDRVERTPSQLGESAAFCRHPQICKPVMETLEQFWDENWEPGIVLIHGPRFSGKRQALSYALEQIARDEGGPLYIDVHPGVRRESVIAPLVNSLRGWDLAEVSAHLRAVERPSWEARTGLIEMLLDQRSAALCPDSLQRDFLIAYGLFVQSFVRRMDSLLLPAVMVCDDSQDYQTETIEILGGLFERFLSSEVFLPVLVSQKPYLPPELRDFPYHKLRIPSIDDAAIAELSRRYLEGSPGGVREPGWIRERCGGNISSMFFLFYRLQKSREGEDGQQPVPEGLGSAWAVVSGLGMSEKVMLYVAMRTWELLPAAGILETASAFDIPSARIPEIVALLTGLNLLRSDVAMKPTVPELEGLFPRLADFDAKEAKHKIAVRLFDLWRGQLIPVSEVLFRVCRGALEDAQERELFRGLISDLLDRRELSEAFRLVYTDCPYRVDGAPGDAAPVETAVVLGLRLRLALIAGDRHGAEAAFERAEQVEPDSIAGSEAAELLLQRARYLFSAGEQSRSLSLIKEAIIIYQDEKNSRGLAAAHADFGILMLAQEQLNDARDYFVIAGKNVEPESSVQEHVRCQSLEMASQFVFGSYTRVTERLDQLALPVDGAGMREWGLYHRFVRGRVLFELGRYDEAQLQFQTSLTEAQLYNHGPAHRLFYAWLARSLAFAGDSARALVMLRGVKASRETLLFEAEADIFRESFDTALAALDHAAELDPEQDIRNTETLSWRTGFSDLEDLTVGRAGTGSVIDHLLEAYHGYLLARVGHRIEGIAEMHRLTREEPVSKLDPYSHLYYLLYASILPDAKDLDRDPSFEDRLTVMGKAVRNMQERLSRIDRYEDKIFYQRHSRWNGLLFTEARDHNLL